MQLPPSSLQHGYEIVASYEDAGRSGLDLAGRPGLKQLLKAIEAGQSAFEVLLVYDVSRWGRFQNIDESAAYEFQCTQKGVRVIYCAEPFPEEHSVASDLCVSACKFDPLMECAPSGGHFQAAVLPVCRMC